jgi:hypothetical protein
MRILKPVSAFSIILVTFVIWSALASMTFAAPITFTFSGTGSGTVNGVPFTDADYTITLLGDTTAITNPSSGLFQLETIAAINIAGVGTATITDPVEIFDNHDGASRFRTRNWLHPVACEQYSICHLRARDTTRSHQWLGCSVVKPVHKPCLDSGADHALVFGGGYVSSLARYHNLDRKCFDSMENYDSIQRYHR